MAGLSRFASKRDLLKSWLRVSSPPYPREFSNGLNVEKRISLGWIHAYQICRSLPCMKWFSGLHITLQIGHISIFLETCTKLGIVLNATSRCSIKLCDLLLRILWDPVLWASSAQASRTGPHSGLSGCRQTGPAFAHWETASASAACPKKQAPPHKYTGLTPFSRSCISAASQSTRKDLQCKNARV